MFHCADPPTITQSATMTWRFTLIVFSMCPCPSQNVSAIYAFTRSGELKLALIACSIYSIEDGLYTAANFQVSCA